FRTRPCRRRETSSRASAPPRARRAPPPERVPRSPRPCAPRGASTRHPPIPERREKGDTRRLELTPVEERQDRRLEREVGDQVRHVRGVEEDVELAAPHALHDTLDDRVVRPVADAVEAA